MVLSTVSTAEYQAHGAERHRHRKVIIRVLPPSIIMMERKVDYLKVSRIPHLALSITAKRAAAPSKTRTIVRPLLLSSPRRCYSLISPQTTRKPAHLCPSQPSLFRNASTKKPARELPDSLRATPDLRAQLENRIALDEEVKKLAVQRFRKKLHMSTSLYLTLSCIFGFLIALEIVYTYSSYRRSIAEYEDVDLPQNADVSSRWLDMSRNFDDEVELSELVMFLHRKREHLCRQARGNVLEVSAGTGRNMNLYELNSSLPSEDRRIRSLVFNDLSEIMLYQAQKKFEEGQEKILKEDMKFIGPVHFVVGDASDERLIRRPEGGFDAVIQTMGICSETNPVAFLKRLGELCRQPGEKSTGIYAKVIEQEARQRLEDLKKAKDYGAVEAEQDENLNALIIEAGGDLGGKILLLEHGRSYLSFLNRILDNGAKMHADHYGCWWNKDIEQVVKDSGLIVEKKRRYHFGTTYEYVLRPRPKSQSAISEVLVEKGEVKDAVVEAAEDIKPKTKSLGWFGRD